MKRLIALAVLLAMTVDVYAGRVYELFSRHFDGQVTICTYIDHNAHIERVVYVGNIKCNRVVVSA